MLANVDAMYIHRVYRHERCKARPKYARERVHIYKICCSTRSCSPMSTQLYTKFRFMRVYVCMYVF
jgi:hypothetical protein